MVKQIIWTKSALNEKLQILDYWKNRNKSTIYSKHLNQLFNNTIVLINENTTIGRHTEINGIKNIIVKYYLLFYEETKDAIVILHKWDSRRNPNDIKYKLK
jgi:toxin YoeB